MNDYNYDRLPTGLLDTLHELVAAACGTEDAPGRQAFGAAPEVDAKCEQIKIDVRLGDQTCITLLGGGWGSQMENAQAAAYVIRDRLADIRRHQEELKNRLSEEGAYLRRLAIESGNLFEVVEFRFGGHDLTSPIRPRQLTLEADIRVPKNSWEQGVLTVEARTLAQLRAEIRAKATDRRDSLTSQWNVAVKRCGAAPSGKVRTRVPAEEDQA